MVCEFQAAQYQTCNLVISAKRLWRLGQKMLSSGEMVPGREILCCCLCYQLKADFLPNKSPYYAVPDQGGIGRPLLNAFAAFSLWWELYAQLYTLPVYLNWDLPDPKQEKEFHSIRTLIYFGTTGVFKEHKGLLMVKLWITSLPPRSSYWGEL